MKTNPRNILIGAIVVVLIILFAGYQFGYKPNAEQAETVEKENVQLEGRKNELNNKIANKSMYQEGIDNAQKLVDAVFEKYGPGNTPEKTIMMIVDLCNKTGVSIDSITFSEEQVIYQNGTGTENDPVKNTLYKTSSSINASAGYTQFKKLFDYINNYPERMNVKEFMVTFNQENKKSKVNMTVDMYSVEDDNHVYVAPAIEDIPLGTENIFGFITPAVEGEEGEGEEGTGDQVTEE